MKNRFRIVAGGTVGLLLAYAAGPLWAGWSLRQAVRERNVTKLETLVDWPELRNNLRPRLASTIRDSAARNGVVIGAVKRAVGDVLVDAAVDKAVTPWTLGRVLAGRAFVLATFPGGDVKSGAATDDDPEDIDPAPPRRLRWAFFESPTRFRIEATHPRLSEGSRVAAILALEGFKWRLVDVKITK